jgi:hypothetical protein
MTRPSAHASAFRAFAFGAGFAVMCLLGIGLWASWRRTQLRDPMSADGEADARAVLEFAADRRPEDLRQDLLLRARLEDLVKERGMVGALVVDLEGNVVARAGELASPVVDAALEDVAAKPGAREIGENMLYRQANAKLVAVVIEDRRPVDAAWRPVRNHGLLAGVIAILLAPLVGIFLARRLAARIPS